MAHHYKTLAKARDGADQYENMGHTVTLEIVGDGFILRVFS